VADLEESKELASNKKRKGQLIDELNILQETLENKERQKFKNHRGMKDIVQEIDHELEYVNKHINRMKKAGAITRSFIRNGVSKKFKYSTERFANINRTILVMDTDSKQADASKYKEDIHMVQLRIDDLANKLHQENQSKNELGERGNKLNLGEMFPPRLPRPSNRRESREELNKLRDKKGDNDAARQIKLNEAGQLCIEANCLFNGHGWEKNIELAIYKYDQAAKMGNVKSMVALGKIYEEGIGVRVDPIEAFKNYHMAAWKNDPQALYKFGQLLEKGIGVEEDNSPSKVAKQIIVCYK
jgi:hypothetical protein